MKRKPVSASQLLNQIERGSKQIQYSSFTGDMPAMKAMAEAQGHSIQSLISSEMANSPYSVEAGANSKILEGSEFAAAANIELVFTRTSSAGTSANLGDLPAIIGLPASRANDFQDIYSQFLTVAGLTLVVGRANGNLTLTYSNGTDTDVVTVGCRDLPYNTFLEGLKFSTISAWMARFSVPSTALQQLSRAFNFFVQTPFGLAKKNTLVPSQYRSPMNQQTNIVDITVPISLGAVTGLVVPVAVGNVGASNENSLNLAAKRYTSALI